MLYVLLKSCGNPDKGEDPNKAKPHSQRARTAQVNSVEEANDVCGEYITFNDLGAGNWAGGEIFKDKEKTEYVGRIAYNGRFFDKEHEYGKRWESY